MIERRAIESNRYQWVLANRHKKPAEREGLDCNPAGEPLSRVGETGSCVLLCDPIIQPRACVPSALQPDAGRAEEDRAQSLFIQRPKWSG